MFNSIPNPPLNTYPIPEADQENPLWINSMIPTWGSDIDWSVPPQVGGLVETSKGWDVLTLHC